MFFKRFIPKSLFGRFLLIITIPTLIAQAVAIYVFYYSHIDTISKHMARGVLGEMLFVKKTVHIAENQKLFKEFSENIDMRFSFRYGKKLSKKAKISRDNYKPKKILGFFNPLPIVDPLNRFKIELKNYGFTPFAIYNHPFRNDYLVVDVQLKDGVLSYEIPIKRITSSTKTVFTLWMITTSLLMSIIAIIFLKNQIRSIKGLSIAAEKFGRGQNVPDFKPSGADEIRSVGISFIKMKERIARQISQRTDMLSAVSHDLRTPLTRMKLQLEMMPESEEKDELKIDISDMEKMVNEYLDFARGGSREGTKATKIKDFLERIVLYYKKIGKEIVQKLELDNLLEIEVKRSNLQRAVRNLVDNAFSHANKVMITSFVTNERLKIIVDDDGPGVPKPERENIFKPFYRIDNSRNLDKTGAGLGLSIVMDVVKSHGGRVEIDDCPLGGLRVIINLPI